LGEFANDGHDSRSIHATYFERLEHIKEVLPKHRKGKSTDFNGLKEEFIGTWYQSDNNMKKAVLAIKTFENKPKVK
jgi:hypothetical protein